MTEDDLRKELIKLFSKLDQVKDFYAQELLSDADRDKMLEECKQKIYNEFWTRGGNPRMPNNKNIRTYIANFEKVATFPYDVIDLLLYRVETATEFANRFGGMPEAAYNSSISAFDKAVKLMKKHKLEDEFKKRCGELFAYSNLSGWYSSQLKELFENID